MKIVFAATGEIAIPLMEALHKEGLISLVLTAPDSPGKRGKQLVAPPLEVYQPETIRTEARNHIASYNADALLSFCYGKIFGPKFLSLFENTFNVHPSLLPLYRGCSPIYEAIRNCDEKTGITLQRIGLGVDEGDVFSSIEIPLDGIESGDVAVLSINKSQNVLHRATYNGVVTENEVKGSDAPENCGVMDLSGRESVRLISQMKLRLRESDNGGSAVRIALKNPVTLKKNEQSDLISPSIYRIKSSDSNEEYVLELTLDNGFGLYDFDTLINNSRPRYASGDNAGRIKNYIAPMSVEGNKILLYVGKLDQDFIFDFYKLYEFEDFEKEIIEESVGKIKLRPISEDERAKIVSINIDEYKEPLDIELTADDSLKLVIFTADNPEALKGLRISLDFVKGESDDGLMCKSYSSRDDSRGYSQNILQQANEDKTFVYDQDEHVDYLVFEDLRTPSENKIRLTIEK